MFLYEKRQGFEGSSGAPVNEEVTDEGGVVGWRPSGNAVTATLDIANGLIMRLTGRAKEMEAIGTAIADPDSAGIVAFGARRVGPRL